MIIKQDQQTVSLFGIPFAKRSRSNIVKVIDDHIKQGHSLRVVTANPIMVMKALQTKTYMDAIQQADLIVPDGTGIVWAAKRWGQPVAERVTGYDLLHDLLQLGQVRQWKVYLLGATPAVVKMAAQRLQQQYPAITIVGYRDGFFSSAEDETVLAHIRAQNPDLLFVARDEDTQEPWLAKYRAQLPFPLLMGVGGSFDVISGQSKRAPQWIQKLRLEWLYRLLKQPRRVTRMRVLPKFIYLVLQQAKKKS